MAKLTKNHFQKVDSKFYEQMSTKLKQYFNLYQSTIKWYINFEVFGPASQKPINY